MPKGYRSSRTMEVPGSIASSSARALKVPANHAPERTRYTSARQWGCLCYADGRGRHAGDVTRLSGGWEGRGREAPPYPDVRQAWRAAPCLALATGRRKPTGK
jgi:hypothetical protein